MIKTLQLLLPAVGTIVLSVFSRSNTNTHNHVRSLDEIILSNFRERIEQLNKEDAEQLEIGKFS